MGLDIYHFHVKDEVTDDPIIVDVSQPQLRKIIHFSRKKTNQYFDHARLLTDHAFSPQDYRMVFQQRRLGATGKFETDDFYFCAADDPDPMNPTRTGLYFTSRRSFLFTPKPHLPPNARKKVKTFKVRQYPMEDRLDDVVYGVSVGYQRKEVVDDFFNEFPPDWAFAERRYAERIFELTVPEARQNFRSNFLDNWDDDHSLVVISW
jgi:hypothetical protein